MGKSKLLKGAEYEAAKKRSAARRLKATGKAKPRPGKAVVLDIKPLLKKATVFKRSHNITRAEPGVVMDGKSGND